MEASDPVFFQERDPYAILGVPSSADQATIKSSYRALARRYHPDLAASDAARRRMIEVNRAWEVLGDPARRAEHDRRRSRGGPRDAGPGSRPEWMARHAADARPAQGWGAGAAGRPPGNPSGSVLAFGIYLGWSLGEIARVDPVYLDWLAERPEGRPYRGEIEGLRRPGPPEAARGQRAWGFR